METKIQRNNMCRDIYICVGLFMCCYIVECITIKHFIIIRAGRKRRRIKGILSKSVLLAAFATIQSVKKSRSEFRVDASFEFELTSCYII